MTGARLAAVVSMVATAACTRSAELIDDGSIPGLIAIDVTPATTTIDIDDLTAHERVELVAVGRFESGETRDVTSLVTWTVDNRHPGDFVEPGLWESSNRAGGPVAAVARAGDVTGQGAIEVTSAPASTTTTSHRRQGCRRCSTPLPPRPATLTARRRSRIPPTR